MQSKWKKRGFILSTDAAVFLFVLTLLLSLGVFYISSAINTARIRTAQGDLAALGSAVSQYHYEMKAYPANIDTLKSANGQYGPWIVSNTKTVDPWGRAYILQTDGTKERFVVYSTGPKGGGTGDVNNGVANGGIGFVGK